MNEIQDRKAEARIAALNIKLTRQQNAVEATKAEIHYWQDKLYELVEHPKPTKAK